MEHSQLSLINWYLVIYWMTQSKKGTSNNR